jgi:hypothetical protein
MLILCVSSFLLLLTPQERDIVNLKAPRLDKEEIEYLAENRRQMRKIDKTEKKIINVRKSSISTLPRGVQVTSTEGWLQARPGLKHT